MSTIRVLAVAILSLLPLSAGAVEKLHCNDSAYVPGVTVEGRRIPPADLKPPVAVEANPYVVARQRLPQTPLTPDVFVELFVQDLDRALNPPLCPPPVVPTPRPRPR